MQFQDCQEGKGPGPIPPELTGAGEGAYQRFKNIYCNANRPYQVRLTKGKIGFYLKNLRFYFEQLGF
jgi:hypothetical protein